jgi:hypothetical protein
LSPEEQTQWAEKVVRAVSEAFPSVEFAVWDKCERLVPSAQVCAALVDEYGLSFPEAARLLNQTGCYLDEHARYAEVELRYRRALAIDEHFYGSNHPEVATDLNNLAQLLKDTNRQPRPSEEKARPVLSEVEGTGHPMLPVGTRVGYLPFGHQAKKRCAEILERV